jgi:hypothetical protein
MYNLYRHKSSVWIAPKGAIENGVQTYGAPIEHLLNIRPTNSYSDLIEFGADHINYARATVPHGYAGAEELSMAYVLVAKPSTTDKLAKTADYILKSHIAGFEVDVLLFEKVKR